MVADEQQGLWDTTIEDAELLEAVRIEFAFRDASEKIKKRFKTSRSGNKKRINELLERNGIGDLEDGTRVQLGMVDGRPAVVDVTTYNGEGHEMPAYTRKGVRQLRLISDEDSE